MIDGRAASRQIRTPEQEKNAIEAFKRMKHSKPEKEKGCRHQFNATNNGGITDKCIHCGKTLNEINL